MQYFEGVSYFIGSVLKCINDEEMAFWGMQGLIYKSGLDKENISYLLDSHIKILRNIIEVENSDIKTMDIGFIKENLIKYLCDFNILSIIIDNFAIVFSIKNIKKLGWLARSV